MPRSLPPCAPRPSLCNLVPHLVGEKQPRSCRLTARRTLGRDHSCSARAFANPPALERLAAAPTCVASSQLVDARRTSGPRLIKDLALGFCPPRAGLRCCLSPAKAVALPSAFMLVNRERETNDPCAHLFFPSSLLLSIFSRSLPRFFFSEAVVASAAFFYDHPRRLLPSPLL